MIKNYFLIFFSPLISLVIIGAIIFYLFKKAQSIKPSPRDYILFINLERKLGKYVSEEKISRYLQEFEGAILNILIKILQKIKIEALRLQVWAEKHLTTFRERQK